ncbi:MAG: KUP/HAK/KT family potassium transporter [Candidatus Gastranaerophilales bacterium]|nr:KUP/HAK/KT family potassium transporter [Candidatus Gastranaerophilales bacterium]
MSELKTSAKNIIQAMGLVFGDIGTSPIYTLTVIFLTTKVTEENVIGVLSLIVWSLLLIVTVQYTWLAMSLSKRGEGGTIVLNEILRKLLKSSRPIVFFSFLTYIGISLLIGDSVITPSISILSAVEGLKLIPHLNHIPQYAVLVITLVIAISLFSIQKKGTENVSKMFGPIMVVWFLALGLSGVHSIMESNSVLLAFNPLQGINFILHNGLAGFFVLAEVILCVTGAEALYADMGHLGRKPIVYAWYIVFCALVISYLGQGAFLIRHPEAQNLLFSMVLSQSHLLYIPFLLTSIFATIIASQAMISGLFAIVYQGINTRILPMFKVDYTSEKINSQIYIGTANWFLLFFVIVIILIFQESSKLASAYGLAVIGTFNITITLMATIFFLRKKYFHFLITLGLFVIDFSYLIAALSKIHTGAYWSLIIASFPLALIVLYIKGQETMFKSIKLMDKEEFLQEYDKLYPVTSKIEGKALFFARGIEKVPPYIVQTMFMNNIIYTENIFVQVNKTSGAFGLHYNLEQVAQGLNILTIEVGYMEVFRLEKVLKALDIEEKAIFYGVEDIETNNLFWHIFSIIKKITPTFVSFYKLPTHKIHGVITQIKM